MSAGRGRSLSGLATPRCCAQASESHPKLARAQLEALKIQLQPHFLFNTLNTISALLHRDPEAADRVVPDWATCCV